MTNRLEFCKTGGLHKVATIWARGGSSIVEGTPERSVEVVVNHDNDAKGSRGFMFENLGPRKTINRGPDDKARMQATVRRIATRACPFGN